MSGDKNHDSLVNIHYRGLCARAYWKLRELRELGFTIDDLAAMSGCSRTTVWRMSEKATYRPSVENLERVLSMNAFLQRPLPGFE